MRAIERGFPQKEIADASYAYQRAVENREKIIVGVNEYRGGGRAAGDPAHRRVGARLADRQSCSGCAPVAPTRPSLHSLDALRRALALEPRAGRGSLSAANTMPYLLDCVRAYATLGEICDAMRGVLGTYEEVSIA